jgi:hypothetical protein
MSIRISGEQYYWPNGRIPFLIDLQQFPVGTSNYNIIQAAIMHYNNNTVLYLSPRDGEANAVMFTVGTDACASPIGMQGGLQQLACELSTLSVPHVIHELGHAAGLWHEMSREDRDRFVTIHEANILPDKLHNFAKHVNDGDDIGTYDYGSIMHYGSHLWAINKALPTIVAPVPIGGAAGLSPGDQTALLLTYSERTDWTLMVGALMHVSNAAADVQWGVSSANNIFRRNGNDWDRMPGQLKQISVASDGSVWGVTREDNIYRWNGSDWNQMPGQLKQISVASDGSVWGVTREDNIYRGWV